MRGCSSCTLQPQGGEAAGGVGAAAAAQPWMLMRGRRECGDVCMSYSARAQDNNKRCESEPRIRERILQ